MTLATSQQTFSVPFRHLRSTYFLDENGTASERSTARPDQQPNGLVRFIGDEPNLILKYLSLASSENRSEIATIQWPLVLFGPSGTGKTSLAMTVMADICDQLDSEDPTKNPTFISALDFDRRYRAAIETNSIEDFRRRLAASPGIIVDDVQKLAPKAAAQNELIQLIDILTEKNRPFIATLDSAPQCIKGLSPQLVSRLSGGLSLPVNPPGPSARREIICDLASINNINLTDDSIELLVNRLNVTVPKLVHFFAQIKTTLRIEEDDDSSIDSTKLTRLFKKSKEDLDTLSRLITKTVAAEFHLKPADLKSNSRKQSIVLARGVAIYLNRILLGNSFLKIGSYYGNRDHSTVMHSFRKIENLLSNPAGNDSASVIGSIEKLKQNLTEQFASQINFF